ncbi:MAG: hypothetical protein ACLUEK_16125 [Oscillospiraceae bacterium]
MRSIWRSTICVFSLTAVPRAVTASDVFHSLRNAKSASSKYAAGS